MAPENKGNIWKIETLTLCWFVFPKTLLLTKACSVLRLNFRPHFSKCTLKMDDKAAFLCQTKHIHHSAQSNSNIQQLDHEEKHFYWIQTQEPGQRGHYIRELQLQ